ncbi:uncharacterized protein L203_101227 [Cryptococcus depauperatus CBS 7841]|uniref:Secreted protein n=1 Tax=Cryptococcus depauperatus CBS 7841 TaxID=1295531 RepID=A0AAJ8JPK5_9TREE
MGGFGQWIIAPFIWVLLSSLGGTIGGCRPACTAVRAVVGRCAWDGMRVRRGNDDKIARTRSSFVRYSASISREMWQSITQENRSSSDSSDKVSPSTWENLFDSFWRLESNFGMARYVISATQGGQAGRVKVTRPRSHVGTCEAARHGMVEVRECRVFGFDPSTKSSQRLCCGFRIVGRGSSAMRVGWQQRIRIRGCLLQNTPLAWVAMVAMVGWVKCRGLRRKWELS